MADRTVTITLDANVGPYTSKLNQASSATKNLAQSATSATSTVTQGTAQATQSTSKLGGMLGAGVAKGAKMAVGAVLGLGAAVGGLVAKGGIDRALAIENAQAKLSGLGHSTESVKGIMDSALASVKGTAFGLGDAAGVAASTVAAGIKPGEDLTRTLKMTADAATIAGTSMGDMGAIVNKVASTGKAQGEVIRQLGERGIPILQLLADQMGVSAAEVSKLASQGKVDFATFQAAMEAGMGGAALKSGETFTGSLKNLYAALGRLGEKAATPALGMLTGVFQSATGAVDRLTAAAEPLVTRVFDQLGPKIEKVKAALDGLGGGQIAGGFSKLAAAAPALGGGIAAIAASSSKAIPILGKLGISLNPWVAGIGAAVALSPELRGAVTGLLSAFSPLIPVIVQVGTDLAGLASKALVPVAGALTAVTPLVSLLATGLSKIPGPVLAGVAALIAFKVASTAVKTAADGSMLQRMATGFKTVQTTSYLAASGIRMSVAEARASGGAMGVMSGGLRAAGTAAKGFGVALKGAFVNNPVGLAIMAVTTALTAFSAAQADAKARTDAYADSIDKTTGKLTSSAKEIAANAFITGEGADWGWYQKWGSGVDSVADGFDKLGLSMRDAIDAAAGSREELDSYLQTLDSVKTSDNAQLVNELTIKLEQQHSAMGEAERQAGQYKDAMGDAADATDKLASAEGDAAGAAGMAASAQDAAAGSYNETTGEVTKQISALDALIAKQNEAAGVALSERQAARQQASAYDAAKKAIADNGKELDIRTEKGRANQDALDSYAQSALKSAEAMSAAGQSGQTVANKLSASHFAFTKLAEGMGYSKKEAKDLADELIGIPGEVKSAVDVDVAEADKRINSFEARAGRAKAKMVVDASTAPADKKVEASKAKTNATTGTMKADIDTSQVDKKTAAEKSKIDGTKGTMTADANTAPADKKVAVSVSKTNAQKPKLTVDAITAPADKKVTDQKSKIDRTKGTMTADANTAPAVTKSKAASTSISGLKPELTLGANTRPAISQGQGASRSLDGLHPQMQLGANNDPALSTGYSTQSTLNSLSSTITVRAVVDQRSLGQAKAAAAAAGKAGNHAATGGPIFGPGTGTSDSIPAMLSNGEHVWTAREVQAVGGQDAMYRLRAAALSGALPRFAKGGAVGPAQRLRAARDAYLRAQQVAQQASRRVSTAERAVKSDQKSLTTLQRRYSDIPSSDKERKAAAKLAVRRQQDDLRKSRDKLASAKKKASAATKKMKAAEKKAKAAQKAVLKADKAEIAAMQKLRAADAKAAAAKKAANAKAAAAKKAADAKAAAKAAAEAKAKREAAAKAERERQVRLGDLRAEYGTDIRRGNIRDAVTGGLSSAYGVVDKLTDLSKNADLSKGARASLSKMASTSERQLTTQYAQQERITAQLEKQNSLYEEMQQRQKQVSDQLKDELDLRSLITDEASTQNTTQHTNANGDIWHTSNTATTGGGVTGRDVKAAVQNKASQLAGFLTRLNKLRAKGLHPALIDEVIAAGSVQGSQLADAVLSMNATDLKATNKAYKDIESYSDKIGNLAVQSGYGVGIDYQKGIVNGLTKQQKAVENAILSTAKLMESTMKKALGIRSPAKSGIYVGEMLDAGIIRGVDNLKPAIDKSLTNLVDPSLMVPQIAPTVSYTPAAVVASQAAAASGLTPSDWSQLYRMLAAVKSGPATLVVGDQQMDVYVDGRIDRADSAIGGAY